MRIGMTAFGLAASLFMAAAGLGLPQAMAAPLSVKPVAASQSPVIQVQSDPEWLRKRRLHRHSLQGGKESQWRYNRQLHGERYHQRHGRYRHYHNGFWYMSPFWLNFGPFGGSHFGFGFYGYPRYGDDWISWCSRRYRSFNPATGMYFTGKKWKPCRPPYGYVR